MLTASQLLALTETPLQRRLGYGSQESYYEFRLVELQAGGMVGTVRGFHPLSVPMQRRSRSGSNDSMEDNTSLAPKEEGKLIHYLLLIHSSHSYSFD